MELFNIISSIKGQIETFDNINNLIDLGRVYYRLVNYNKFIKLYIPNTLFQIYLILLFSLLLFSNLFHSNQMLQFFLLSTRAFL